MPYAVIPLLAILGAVAVMLMIWSFARLLHDPEGLVQNFSDSQMQYMREVRHRNRQDIADLFNYRRYFPPRRYSHQYSQKDEESKVGWQPSQHQ